MVIAAFLAGPSLVREPLPYNAEKSATIASLADGVAIDQYLEQSEQQTDHIRPGLDKGVLWRDRFNKTKTKIAFVYLHGFSASRAEIEPVVSLAANEVGANIFFTRLKAHGRTSGDGFASVQAQDWIDDAREALAIGRKIGERVILVGMSTGADLAVLLANENRDAKDIAGLVLLSPNYSPAQRGAKFLAGPLGEIWARLLVGGEHSFKPKSVDHALYWTPRMPSRGLVALMDVVVLTSRIDFSRVTFPVLTLYTSHDSVVDVELIRQRHAEFGSERKLIVDVAESNSHELANQWFAPQAVMRVVKLIAEFARDVGAGVAGATGVAAGGTAATDAEMGVTESSAAATDATQSEATQSKTTSAPSVGESPSHAKNSESPPLNK